MLSRIHDVTQARIRDRHYRGRRLTVRRGGKERVFGSTRKVVQRWVSGISAPFERCSILLFAGSNVSNLQQRNLSATSADFVPLIFKGNNVPLLEHLLLTNI